MTGTAFRVIRPRKRAPAKPKLKAPTPEPRVLEHVHFGHGKLVGLRQLDNGDRTVQVEFGDGATRTIRLDQSYWITPISELLPAPPTPIRRVAKPQNDASDADGEPCADPLMAA